VVNFAAPVDWGVPVASEEGDGGGDSSIFNTYTNTPVAATPAATTAPAAPAGAAEEDIDGVPFEEEEEDIDGVAYESD